MTADEPASRPPRRWHIFLSYARADNGSAGDGWVTAFRDWLEKERRSFGEEDLDIFFDKTHIHDMDDWRARIEQHLRSSTIFIAFLSPHYLRSDNCDWELGEYLAREAALVHGNDGIAQIFLIDEPELDPKAIPSTSLKRSFRALRERHHEQLDLRDWHEEGLAWLKATHALTQPEELVRENVQAGRFLEGIKGLNQRIIERLDRVRLAERAPSRSFPRSLATWVGRKEELSRLHATLTRGRTGVVTALQGLGGLGKSALANQYAHAFAPHYVTGGRWWVSCEGLHTIDEAFARLARDEELGFEKVGEEPDLASVLAGLERFALTRAAEMAREAGASRPVEFTPRMLVILDNVSDARVFDASALARLPEADWLHVLITTRLDASDVTPTRSLEAVEVMPLSLDDAYRLLCEMQPEHRFASRQEAAAARSIAEMLDGFTLAVESAAVYLRLRLATATEYLEALRADGLDTLRISAHETRSATRHREKQLAAVLAPSIAMLEAPALLALQRASFFDPDMIGERWLFDLVAERMPEIKSRKGLADPWVDVRRRLEGLHLLRAVDWTDEGRPRRYQMHRLVAAYVQTTVDDVAAIREDVVDYLGSWSRDLMNAIDSDASLIRALPPLSAQIDLFATTNPTAPGLVDIEVVCGTIEMRKGSFSRGGALLQSAFDRCETVDRVHSSFKHMAGRHLIGHQLATYLLQRGGKVNLDAALACAEEVYLICQERYRPDELGSVHDLAGAAQLLCKALLTDPSRTDEARRHCEEAVGLCERALQANPLDDQCAREAADSLSHLGDFHFGRGGIGQDKALELYRAALSHRKNQYRAHKGHAEYRRNYQLGLGRVGVVLQSRGRPEDRDEALACLTEEERLCQEALFESPEDRQALEDLATCERNIASFWFVPGSENLGGVLGALQLAETHGRRLLERDPNDPQALIDLCETLILLGKARRNRLGTVDEVQSIAASLEAADLANLVRERAPGDLGAGRRHVRALTDLATAYLTFDYERAASEAYFEASTFAVGQCEARLDAEAAAAALLTFRGYIVASRLAFGNAADAPMIVMLANQAIAMYNLFVQESWPIPDWVRAFALDCRDNYLHYGSDRDKPS